MQLKESKEAERSVMDKYLALFKQHRYLSLLPPRPPPSPP